MADRPRVLYIDDEPGLLTIGKLFLEREGAFAVDTLLSASEALTRLDTMRYDAIISDYQMPGLDGIAFLKQLRAAGNSTPFIIFTGRGREEVVIEALNEGADFYIQKGGDPRSQFTELVHKVKRAIDQRRVVQALQASEEKYRHLIEHSGEAIVVVQDGMLRLINHRAVEFTGYSEQDLLSMSIFDFIHPDDRAMVAERYRRRLEGTDAPSRYSFRLDSKDGSTTWVEISIVMIEWEGRPATLNYLTDITERRQAEEALKIQHDLSLVLNHYTRLDEALSQILNAAMQIEGLDAGGIYKADPVTGALDIVAHQGLSPQFIAHTSHFDANSPQVQRARTGSPFYGKYSEIRPPGRDEIRDKEQVTALASIPVMHEGELVSIMNLASHTAEEIPVRTRQTLETLAMQVGTALVRIRSRKALEESEARYRSVVEDQTELICRFLPDGTHVFVNEAYCRYFGILREKIIGSRFRPHIPREDQEIVARAISSLTPDHQLETIEQRIIMPDGAIRWQRWVDRAIFDVEGMLVEYQSVGRDITDLKEREMAVKQKNDELRASYEQIASDEEKLRRQVEEITTAQKAYRESEQKFRAIFNHTFQFIGLVTLDGTLIDANQSSLSSLGITRDEVIGKPFWETPWWTHSPELQEELKSAVSAAVQGTFIRFEASHPAIDGSIHEIDFSLKPVTDESGRVIYLIPEGRDITERKRAEETLHETERRLEDIINFLPDATFAIDSGGRVIAWNRAIEEMTGVSAEDILGKGNYEYAIPFYGERRPILIDLVMMKDQGVLNNYSSVQKEGDALTAETDRARVGGKDVYLWGKSVLFKNFRGEVVGAIESIRDITDRKLTEVALREREETFRSLVQESSDGIVIADEEGKIIVWNNATTLITGIPGDEALGSLYVDLVVSTIVPERRGDDRIRRIRSRIDTELKTGISESFSRPLVAEIIRRDGQRRYIQQIAFPIRTTKGFRIGSIVRDVTDRKRAEEELRKKNEELNASYEQIAAAEGELRSNLDEIIRTGEALRESEVRYRLINDATLDFVYSYDKTGRFTSANRSLCTALDLRADQIIGRTHAELGFPVAQCRDWDELHRRVYETRTTLTALTTSPIPDGAIHQYEVVLNPLYDSDGTISGIAGTTRDITERKRAEDELRETERRLEDIINFLPDATFAIDSGGRVIAWNRAIEEMTGVRAKDMLGKGDYEYALPFYGERRPILIDLVMMQDQRVLNNYSAVQKDGDALTAETDRAHVGGKDVCLWGKSVLFKNSHGEVVGAIESIRDITDRKMVEIALEKSRNLYRAIFQTTGAATIIINSDTTIILANSGFAKLSGFSIDELEGKKSWTEFVTREDLEWMKQYHHDRRDDPSGTPGVYEFRFVNRYGETRHCLNNVGVIPGTTRSVASVVDITGLKEAETTLLQTLDKLTLNEQDLRESEEKYRTVFENTGTATVVLDESACIELANNGFAQLSGFSKEEIEGKKRWTEFVVPEDLERMRAQHHLRRQDREKALTRYEFRFVTKTGDIRFIYLFIDVIPGTKKSIASLLDITDRKQAEELYQTVFENTGTAMAIIEENSVISHVNEEMEKIWGYSREEIEGKVKWQTLVAEEDLGKMMNFKRLRRTDPGTIPRDYEFRFIHKNGEVRDASLTVAIIPGTKKSVVSLRDITELKILDLEVKERTVQVEQLLRQKDEFIAQAGHDLKTPLTPIIALLPHICKKEQDPELRGLLEMVMSDAAAMKHLITDILTLAELNKPYTMPDTRELVLADEIEKGITKHAWTAEKQGNVMVNTVGPGTRIRIAPFHLESILDNLIGNAIRYSPEGGKVTISSNVTEGFISISVTDTGIGLTLEETTRIFDEFFKADTSRHHRDSSGLGLSIVSRIAHLYGGSVKAESPGKGSGSTFTVTIPC